MQVCLMGSGGTMFRTWSGSEDSSHKMPLVGVRSHQVHLHFCTDFTGDGGAWPRTCVLLRTGTRVPVRACSVYQMNGGS